MSNLFLWPHGIGAERRINGRFKKRISACMMSSRGSFRSRGYVAFICECADDRCFERVELALGQGQAVAGRRDQYLIVAGHPRVQGEQVVDTLGPFEIVSKANV